HRAGRVQFLHENDRSLARTFARNRMDDEAAELVGKGEWACMPCAGAAFGILIRTDRNAPGCERREQDGRQSLTEHFRHSMSSSPSCQRIGSGANACPSAPIPLTANGNGL